MQRSANWVGRHNAVLQYTARHFDEVDLNMLAKPDDSQEAYEMSCRRDSTDADAFCLRRPAGCRPTGPFSSRPRAPRSPQAAMGRTGPPGNQRIDEFAHNMRSRTSS